MEKLPLPTKVEVIAKDQPNLADIVIEPCFSGYGRTIGNALRRVLLSSIEGAAIKAVKIKGVEHEFSTLDNVKEDMVEIILNLKQVRMKIHAEEDVRLAINAKGKKKVTAKDIEAPAEVEIANPDLHIASLTSDEAEFTVELVADRGRGYLPTEERDKENLEIGMIAVDSVYTPIVNVGYSIENVRVGQMTDYEKLTMTVETDGTIDPKSAVEQAADILMDHFALLTKEGLNIAAEKKKQLEEIMKREMAEREEQARQAEEERAKKEAEAAEEEAPKKKRGRPKKVETAEKDAPEPEKELSDEEKKQDNFDEAKE